MKRRRRPNFALEVLQSRIKRYRHMFDQSNEKHGRAPRAATEWVKVLSAYREPSTLRSSFELAVTLGPFILLWALAWASLSVSYVLAIAISFLNAAFLLRLFAIQHD